MKITIEATFGSDFQKRSQGESLLIMLRAWLTFMQDRHKKNKAKITVDGKPLEL